MAPTKAPTYTLTIPNGASVTSTRLRFTDDSAYKAGKQVPSGFCVIAPAELTNTIKIRVHEGAASAILQSGGSDIECPAGRATPLIQHLGWESFELISVDGDGNEAEEDEERVFVVTSVVER